MSLTVRPAVETDALELQDRLCPADVAEIAAASGASPLKALMHGITRGQAWTVEHEGQPAAIFGVIRSPIEPTLGYCWLLATPELEKCPVTAVRQAKVHLDRLAAGFDVITNYVDARNQAHLKLLTHLGFELGRVVDRFGIEERPFIQVSYFPSEPKNACV